MTKISQMSNLKSIKTSNFIFLETVPENFIRKSYKNKNCIGIAFIYAGLQRSILGDCPQVKWISYGSFQKVYG